MQWALADEYRAQMAGLQVQMRQIEDANTDMLQDQQRFVLHSVLRRLRFLSLTSPRLVNMLDRVTSPRRTCSHEQALNEGYSSNDEVS